MNYDDWKSADPDPQPDGRRESDPPFWRCRDCGEEVIEGGHGAPWVQAVYCDPCWRWRTVRDLEFDSRAKVQIERDQRKGAA